METDTDTWRRLPEYLLGVSESGDEYLIRCHPPRFVALNLVGTDGIWRAANPVWLDPPPGWRIAHGLLQEGGAWWRQMLVTAAAKKEE